MAEQYRVFDPVEERHEALHLMVKSRGRAQTEAYLKGLASEFSSVLGRKHETIAEQLRRDAEWVRISGTEHAAAHRLMEVESKLRSVKSRLAILDHQRKGSPVYQRAWEAADREEGRLRQEQRDLLAQTKVRAIY